MTFQEIQTGERKVTVFPDAEGAKEESEKRVAGLCDIPIGVENSANEDLAYQIDHEAFKKSHVLYPSRHSSARSEVFISLWDMMETIVKGVDWQKKARIVLEYDPQERKMELTTYQTTDEGLKMEVR